MNDERQDYVKLEQNDLMNTLERKEPKETSEENLVRNKKISYLVFFLLFKIAWIVVFAIILNKEGDCGQPIRLWIKVLMYFFIVDIGVTPLLKIKKFSSFFSFLRIFIYVLEFIWCSIGTVWFFKDDDCENKWNSGYIVTFVLVILFFISLIPIFCCCCVVISMPLVSRIRLDILK
jgi:hypothetical protein